MCEGGLEFEEQVFGFLHLIIMGYIEMKRYHGVVLVMILSRVSLLSY